MADQDETIIFVVPPAGSTGWGVFTAVVNSTDTVTLASFTDIINWYVIDLADNTEATATQATNVLTITQAGLVTQNILIFAQGS